MTQQNAQLEAIVKEVEGAKTELRGHLHSQLHSVTNLQMKLAESNSQLVLLYEHVKLARKRKESKSGVVIVFMSKATVPAFQV